MKRFLLFLPFAVGCSAEPQPPAPALPPAAERQIEFAKDVQPLFTELCFRCHGPVMQQGKFRADVKEFALNPELVKPGDSAASPLIHHLRGMHDRKRMPPNPPYLTDEQVGVLRAWIDQGATWDEKK